MEDIEEHHGLALVSCLELVMMKKNNTKYHLAQAKLGSLCNCKIKDSYENPKCLRTVLEEVYGNEYSSIIREVKICLDELAKEKGISNFFKIMENSAKSR